MAAIWLCCAIDHGPGMNVDACLRDGFSTAGTAGTGLGAIRRLAHQFEAFSTPAGTIVSAGFGPGDKQPWSRPRSDDMAKACVEIRGAWSDARTRRGSWLRTVWAMASLPRLLPHRRL